jgi:tRNA(Ile)-lysidine synthase
VSSGNRSAITADAAPATPVSAAEAKSLFAGLERAPALVLAVSGGPDSTALMWLAARWRKSLRRRGGGPKLLAVTIDHRLRPEAAREAAAVARLARTLGIAHRTLRWNAQKPAAGLQEAAREARYRLLAAAALAAGARHVLIAHTLDDQAETVLMRLARGSGPSGLAAMARESERDGVVLVRPLLELPKRRLLATLAAEGIPFADDPTNRDARFARPRWRALLRALGGEGLDAARLATLARRMRRVDDAVEALVEAAAVRLAPYPWGTANAIELPASDFSGLPAEVRLRLIKRAIEACGDEGRLELRKLEALSAALDGALAHAARFRRTLAGAMVTLARGRIAVERAPARQRYSHFRSN